MKLIAINSKPDRNTVRSFSAWRPWRFKNLGDLAFEMFDFVAKEIA
jgi:hypothetical protein